MKFDWDPAKNEQNIRIHGIDFNVAVRAFRGPVLERIDDRVDYGETRMVAIGLLDGIEITLVYTDRGEVRRMISARKATHHERHAYYQALNP